MPGIFDQILETCILIMRWILSPINHLFNQQRIGYPPEGVANTAVAPKKDESSPIKDSGAAGSEDEQFAREGLRIHNELRRKHGVPELKLSPVLNNYSKQWAKKLANEDRFEHRPKNEYGENIFYYFSPNLTWKSVAEAACNAWYNEIKDYKFGVEPRSTGTGHFSQMIWKSSEELGFSMEKNKSGKVYVVANYNPPGNFRGQYSANVPPKK